MDSFKKMNLLLLFSVIFLSLQTLAWGGRGHHAICSAAPHLVKDDSLKNFLKFRPHTMGHLCNIPDIYWKSIGPDVSDLGNPTHYIDPELIGLKINLENNEKHIRRSTTIFISIWMDRKVCQRR